MIPLGCAYCFECRIVRVTKSHRIRQLLDLRLLAGQKMPALRRSRPVVHPRVSALLGLGHQRPVRRIDAHGHHFVSLPMSSEFPSAARHRVQHLRAQHRALVIHQRQNHRLLPEILSAARRCCRSRRGTSDPAESFGSISDRCLPRFSNSGRTPALCIGSDASCAAAADAQRH